MKTLLAAATAAALAAAPAAAAVYDLTYTGTSDTTVASLTITTSNHANHAGGFDVLSVSGSVGTDTIVGIVPPNPPGFLTDNVLFHADPVFDVDGLGFASATTTYNLWGTGPGAYTLYGTTSAGASYSPQSTGTLSVTAVPEPAMWGLMLVGFAMTGFAARRRPVATAA